MRNASRFLGQYTLPRTKTELSCEYMVIQPHYSSPGVAFLQSDLKRIKAKVKQPFLQNKILLNAFAENNRNGLSKMDDYNNKFLSAGIEGHFTFPKIPSLFLAYYPTQMNTQYYIFNESSDSSDNETVNFQTDLYLATLYHHFRIRKTNFTSTASYTSFRIPSISDSTVSTSVRNLSVGQSIDLRKNLRFSLNWSMVLTERDTAVQQNNYLAQIEWIPAKNVRLKAGGEYTVYRPGDNIQAITSLVSMGYNVNLNWLIEFRLKYLYSLAKQVPQLETILIPGEDVYNLSMRTEIRF